eukprot:5273377-Lingulodinium_polyedra.AAC.1
MCRGRRSRHAGGASGSPSAVGPTVAQSARTARGPMWAASLEGERRAPSRVWRLARRPAGHRAPSAQSGARSGA